LKGHLTSHGVAYRSVNVLAEPAAMDAMVEGAIRTAPALRIGDRWVAGDEAAIDMALGLAPTGARVPLDPRVLVERSARMLDLSSKLAEQLPPANFDDPTPTVADFVAARRFLLDGQPYTPHGTSKALVHHIAQHGEKTWRLLLASSGLYALGFAIDGTGDYNFFGEPEASTPMYRVVAKMRLTASDLRSWLQSDQPGGFEGVLETHRGPRTMKQYLEVQAVGLVQHTRQLADIIEQLHIEPHGAVAVQDLEGLRMPAGLWD
jgi:hypothetical protein